MKPSLIRFALAAVAAALCSAPALAAAEARVTASAPDRAPTPRRVLLEQNVSLLANVAHFVEQHLGVELLPTSMERAGLGIEPLAPDGAARDRLALGAVPGPEPLGAVSAALSANPHQVRLTLRLRW